MNITILNVTVETKPTAKGSYQQADVAFKNNTYGGKVEGKKVMSFGATADAFKTLALAQPGEIYEVSIVKNDKGYNDWVSMQKAVAAGTPVAANVPGVQRGSTATPAPRSNYETPEERAQRQVYIIRQSSASSAIALHGIGAKAAPKVDDVIATAKKLEAYVLNQAKLGGDTGFDDIPDLDPSFDNGEPNIG